MGRRHHTHRKWKSRNHRDGGSSLLNFLYWVIVNSIAVSIGFYTYKSFDFLSNYYYKIIYFGAIVTLFAFLGRKILYLMKNGKGFRFGRMNLNLFGWLASPGLWITIGIVLLLIVLFVPIAYRSAPLKEISPGSTNACIEGKVRFLKGAVGYMESFGAGADCTSFCNTDLVMSMSSSPEVYCFFDTPTCGCKTTLLRYLYWKFSFMPFGG